MRINSTYGKGFNMNIIGYTYEADCHCVGCAKKRFMCDINADDYLPSRSDRNYIPFDARDREGNTIHAIFSTDENAPNEYCGDCHEKLFQ